MVAVIQQADATGTATGRRMLDTAAAVYMGDKIQTGSIGEAQLRFRDQTRLVVGRNSSLVIDSFVFKNQSTAQDVSINAVRGTFRFITGSSPKSAYSIHTPAATIGVRGTRFDFNIDDGGKMNFVLYEGSANLCDNAGNCVMLRGGCGVAVVSPGQGVKRVTSLSERSSILDSDFPYLRRQSGLQRGFRTDTSSCEIQKASLPEGNGGGSIQSLVPNPTIVVRNSPPPVPPTPEPPPAPKPEKDKDHHKHHHGKHGKGHDKDHDDKDYGDKPHDDGPKWGHRDGDGGMNFGGFRRHGGGSDGDGPKWSSGPTISPNGPTNETPQ